MLIRVPKIWDIKDCDDLFLSKIKFHSVEKTNFGAINTNLISIASYENFKDGNL